MIEEVIEQYQQDTQFIFADREEQFVSLSKQLNDEYFSDTANSIGRIRFESVHTDEFNSFQARLDRPTRKREDSGVANHDEDERVGRGDRWRTFSDRKREKSGSRDRRRQSRREGRDW